MKEIKLMVLLCLFWICIQTAFAQTKPSSALKVGDQVPELTFSNLINSNQKIIKLSDYKGKLVILDFFATWCKPCITALPKLDSLQKEFKDKLVILPITKESLATLNYFLEDRPHLKLSLPYVYGTDLQAQFPFRLLPLEAWIDGDGKLAALTDGEQITSQNIKKMLENKRATLTDKIDILDPDYNKPFSAGLFGSYKIKPEQILYSSSLIQGFNGLANYSMTMPYTNGNTSFIRTTNSLIHKLYQIALLDVGMPAVPWTKPTADIFYKDKQFYKKMMARLIWEAKDSTLFYGKETAARMMTLPWKETSFHYELILPLTDNVTFKKVMLEDLNRYFKTRGLQGGLEKRKVKCYALTVVGSDEKFRSKGGEKSLTLRKGANKFAVNNLRIDDFMFFWLNRLPYLFPTPIINETNYDGAVDLDFGEIDPSNFDQMKEAFKKVGLEFILVERDLDMIVIKDPK